jgi:hypothetical protein
MALIHTTVLKFPFNNKRKASQLNGMDFSPASIGGSLNQAPVCKQTKRKDEFSQLFQIYWYPKVTIYLNHQC